MKTKILILMCLVLITSCKTQKILLDADGDGISDNVDLNPGINDYLMF